MEYCTDVKIKFTKDNLKRALDMMLYGMSAMHHAKPQYCDLLF